MPQNCAHTQKHTLNIYSYRHLFICDGTCMRVWIHISICVYMHAFMNTHTHACTPKHFFLLTSAHLSVWWGQHEMMVLTAVHWWLSMATRKSMGNRCWGNTFTAETRISWHPRLISALSLIASQQSSCKLAERRRFVGNLSCPTSEAFRALTCSWS